MLYSKKISNKRKLENIYKISLCFYKKCWRGNDDSLESSLQTKTFTARLFNVYGERSRTSGTYGAVFGVFLAQKLAKKPFTIVGTGNQSRDFTYVTDVVSALIKIIKSKYYGEVFNIGGGETVSINKIVKLLGGKKNLFLKDPENQI